MKRLATELLLTLLLFVMAGLSHAQQLPIQQQQSDLNRNAGNREIRNPPTTNGRISQRQALSLARARFAGNILRSVLVGDGDNQRWQIRMENEGKVFTVFVHVITGRVSGPA